MGGGGVAVIHGRPRNIREVRRGYIIVLSRVFWAILVGELPCSDKSSKKYQARYNEFLPS